MQFAFDLAQSIAKGELDLLCPQMELRHCSTDSETVMTGSGQIRADKRGQLSFRMSGSLPRDVPAVLRGDKPLGTVYELEDRVILAARDHQGREWHSNPLWVHLTHPAEFVHGYVSRKLESISHSTQWTGNNENTVEMYIPRQRRLPFDKCTTSKRSVGSKELSGSMSIDHHTRRIGDAEVTFREKERDWLLIIARQSAPITAEWRNLMCQAVSFATAGVARPAAAVWTHQDELHIELYSGPFQQHHSLLPRPVASLSPDDADAFWSLVEKFFLFSWQRRDTPMQFLDELQAIRTGAAISLQTACLTLAIGIEAIAKELLPPVSPVGWDQPAKASLEAHITSWEGDSDTRDRVLGWLRSKGEPRPQDRLHAWATANGIKEELISEWSALRNKKAHGSLLVEAQPSYDRYYAVVELLHRIVASAIGYDGSIVATSIRGWQDSKHTATQTG